MRLYLDTNVLLRFLFDKNELGAQAVESLFDFSNILYTSSVCVQELIHLCQIGKIGETIKGKRKPINPALIIPRIREAGIHINPITEKHLQTFAELPLSADHRDPFDRLIIAQAISDRATLMSSDKKFPRYEKNGLQFVYDEQ